MLSNSIIFWGGVILFVALAMRLIDFIFRIVASRQANAEEGIRHRVANELPRTLHKKDHDEVLELVDERGLRKSA